MTKTSANDLAGEPGDHAPEVLEVEGPARPVHFQLAGVQNCGWRKRESGRGAGGETARLPSANQAASPLIPYQILTQGLPGHHEQPLHFPHIFCF
jgi:hypothetical protein